MLPMPILEMVSDLVGSYVGCMFVWFVQWSVGWLLCVETNVDYEC